MKQSNSQILKQAASWSKVVQDELGTVYYDWHDEGVRCRVMRGNFSVCAYLGIPTAHPLANHDYDNIPLDVHGGLTFGKEGDGKYLPRGYYWYGWDYAHLGDSATYYEKYSKLQSGDDKKWLPDEVKAEVETALWDFKRLIRLVERVANR